MKTIEAVLGISFFFGGLFASAYGVKYDSPPLMYGGLTCMLTDSVIMGRQLVEESDALEAERKKDKKY